MNKEKLKKGFRKLQQLAEHDYGISLQGLLAEPDEGKRERRLWRLTGVIVKERFSNPVKRTAARGTGARYRWDIDPNELKKYLDRRSWEAKLLSSFVGRRKNESVYDYALRLKSETKFGKEVKKLACQWMCNDSEITREMQKFFRLGNLGKLLHFSTSAGILAGLSLELATKIPDLSHLEESLVVSITFIIATIGLIAFCKTMGYWPPKRRTRTKRQPNPA